MAAATLPTAGYGMCSDPVTVADATRYGGCMTLGDPGMYAGPLTTITYRCDAPDGADPPADVGEGQGFGSSLLRSDGGEILWPSVRPVTITCT